MTPGISSFKNQVNDQNYRAQEDVDTDFVIVGRAIYNSSSLETDINKFV